MKTKIIIVSAPSGGGKSSFVHRLCEEEKGIRDVITYTTRSPRRGESEGNPYHFVSNEEFKTLVSENFFVEWAQVHDHFYGTPWNQLYQAWSEGLCVIMDIDVQGAQTFRKQFSSEELKTIFILPPSLEELRLRILKRDGQAPANLDLRLKNATQEMALANQFDQQIVNDNFDLSYGQFKKVIDSWLRDD
jgi:guanylate kinase